MKRSDSLPSAQALRAAHLLERVARVVRADGYANGLNPAQWEALRYLARANRFSRTPAALADYLGATRGTVSQTLITLEDKGLIERGAHAHDRRSLSLVLTRSGRTLLQRDSLHDLARDIDAAQASSLADDLEHVLRAALRRRGGRSFGACRTCRHFRRARAGAASPHHCALLDEPLSEADAAAICVDHAGSEE